jgi:hypothetical protein
MRRRRLARWRGGSEAARRGLASVSKDAAEAVVGEVEVLAWGAAVGVGEEGCAVDELGLLGVVGGHGHAAGCKPRLQRQDRGRVGVELEVEGFGGALTGEVVFGGAKAAGEEDDVGAVEGDADGVGEVGAVVADDGFEGDGDAEVVEAGGEIERVGVLAMGRQHFRADSDDFSEHVISMDRIAWGVVGVGNRE